MKKDDKKDLEQLVIEHNTEARVTYELARQLEQYLPITSFEELTEKLAEVTVETHRLPSKIFAPHVPRDLFPIESLEDLVRKLSGGVRTAIAMAHAPNSPISNPAVRALLATGLQAQPGRRAAIPVMYFTGPAPRQGTIAGVQEKPD